MYKTIQQIQKGQLDTKEKHLLKTKGVYSILLKTPSFNLMEDVKKRFGVEFHPNTPISKIGEKLKEMGYYDKRTTQTSATIRQTNSNGKESVRKVEEVTRKEKTVGVQIAPSKASPN